jgi:toxin ParE1/3/4
MRTRILWTPQALEDLLDIYVAIGLDNPAAAERMYSTLEDRAMQLRGSPRMGVRRPEIAPSVRVLVEGVYLILYETHPDTDEGPVESIEIVRIVHGHRDLARLF